MNELNVNELEIMRHIQINFHMKIPQSFNVDESVDDSFLMYEM